MRNSSQHLQCAHVPAILQHEIVEILINADRVHLSRFLPPKDEAEDTLPVAAHVHVQDLGEAASVRLAVLAARDGREKRKEWGRWLFALFVALLLACSTYLIGQHSTSVTSPGPSWHVRQVTPTGVTLSLAQSPDGTPMHIPVGGILPDGQRLLGVDAARHTYSTSQQDVRVRQVIDPAAQLGAATGVQP